jgi:hypothetical protein
METYGREGGKVFDPIHFFWRENTTISDLRKSVLAISQEPSKLKLEFALLRDAAFLFFLQVIYRGN